MREWSRGRAQVDDFVELTSARWRRGINALCWQRTLFGDFDTLARRLAPEEGLADIEPQTLEELDVDDAGRSAVRAVLADWARLTELGLDPQLSAVGSYPRDPRGWPIAVDVHSFHVDRAPFEVDTWLCTYAGAATEALGPGESVRAIDEDHTRATLAALLAVPNDDLDEAFQEHDLDLHYRPLTSPYSMGVGNLWRVAVAWPGAAVPACVHRAPLWPGPRLLLIA